MVGSMVTKGQQRLQVGIHLHVHHGLDGSSLRSDLLWNQWFANEKIPMFQCFPAWFGFPHPFMVSWNSKQLISGCVLSQKQRRNTTKINQAQCLGWFSWPSPSLYQKRSGIPGTRKRGSYVATLFCHVPTWTSTTEQFRNLVNWWIWQFGS